MFNNNLIKAFNFLSNPNFGLSKTQKKFQQNLQNKTHLVLWLVHMIFSLFILVHSTTYLNLYFLKLYKQLLLEKEIWDELFDSPFNLTGV